MAAPRGHAVRPGATVLLFAQGGRLPFDAAPLRSMPEMIALYQAMPEPLRRTVLAREQLALALNRADAARTRRRDAYPGVNAVTLMELRNPPDPRRLAILPIVRYAASRRIATGNPDYWDYATLFELAILGHDEAAATENLTKALPIIRAKWEPETTLNNLRLIRKARQECGENEPEWVAEAMGALEAAAQ